MVSIVVNIYLKAIYKGCHHSWHVLWNRCYFLDCCLKTFCFFLSTFYLSEWHSDYRSSPGSPPNTTVNDKQPGQFQCSVCFKNYSMKHHLVRHRRFECNIDPQFQCPLCPKKCRHKYHLKSHILNKHKDFVKNIYPLTT